MSDEFCTVGPKQIRFWTLTGKPKNGVFGDPKKMTNISCVTYDEQGRAYTGGTNGEIYRWQGGSLISTHPFHKGSIHCINYIHDKSDGTRALISGGADTLVLIINPDDMTAF